MSINSFTALASGDATFASSVFLIAVWSDTPYKMSVEQLSNIGANDIGARWVANSDQNIAAASTHMVARHFGSLHYDTNSWTDAATPGIFRVPNDKYTHVEMGFCMFVGEGVNLVMSVLNNDNFGAAFAVPCAIDKQSGGTFLRLVGASPPIPVSSGDIIRPYVYPGQAASLQAGSQYSIWVRGIRATP